MPDIKGVENEVFWATAVEMVNRSMAMVFALEENGHPASENAIAELEALSKRLRDFLKQVKE